MEGLLTMVGSLVVIILLFCLLGYLWNKVSNMFPGIRASRQEKKFKRGKDYATKLMSGSIDNDVRRRAGDSTMVVGKKERIEYARDLLSESRAFGQVDNFDRGVESIIDAEDEV